MQKLYESVSCNALLIALITYCLHGWLELLTLLLLPTWITQTVGVTHVTHIASFDDIENSIFV